MSERPILSIIVTMGFVEQTNVEFPDRGDEFEHMAVGVGAKCDWELVIVDRAWPSRWERAKEACGSLGDRLLYVPTRPSLIVESGYRAVNTMRNSGAMCARGELFAFVDDFCLLRPETIDEICEHYSRKQRILCPTFHDEFDSGIPDGYSECIGHNPAIYMCTRQQFTELNGFEEHFDGSYGEGDTEWQGRLDALLRALYGERMRLRKKGLFFRRTWHRNGLIPQELIPPWPNASKDRNSLRCNRAFFQAVTSPRLERGEFVGNKMVDADEVDRLSSWMCIPDCNACGREDRTDQVASYERFKADGNDGNEMLTDLTKGRSGSFDPWEISRGS